MSEASPRSALQKTFSRRSATFALAVLLPIASAFITTHVRALYPYPQALAFLAIALLASLEGFGPALLAVFVTILARVWQVKAGLPPPFAFQSDFIRFSILLAAAIIISVAVRRRRRSEAALETALDNLHERTDALVESLNSSKCASWIIDLDTDSITRWYSGSYLIFGRPFSDINDFRTLRDLFHPEDRERLSALVKHFNTSNDPIGFEHRVLWPNGDIHWLEVRATRIAGPHKRWRGLTFDITERKHTEDALLRSEKLAAMGRLASTVAHEINNPLEAVTNLLYLVRDDRTLNETTRSYVDTAERELLRLGNITRLTLGFVRNSTSAVVVDIAETLDDVLSLLQHRFVMKNIHLERHFETSVRITIAPHELRQIATNLIANAADAVAPTGGIISIRIAHEDGLAVLAIEDNGDGIEPANLQRIFDPFFTTRSEVGTGIGLWVTKEIVEKNGGHIAVESGDLPSGFRTCFRIHFPPA